MEFKNLSPKLIMVLCGLLLLTCEKQDDEIPSENVQTETLNISRLSWNHLDEEHPGIQKKILKSLNANEGTGVAKSKDRDFDVDLTAAQVIERKNYTTFTFMAYRDDLTPNLLENYVLKKHKNGKVKQFLVGYRYQLDEHGQKVFDSNYLEIKRFGGDDLIVNRLSCVPMLLETEESYSCTYGSVCTGSGHTDPDDDNCECQRTVMDCYRANTTICDVTTVYIYSDCGGGGGSTTTTTTTTTTGVSGGGGSNTSDDDTTTITPYEANTTAMLIEGCINKDPVLFGSGSSTFVATGYVAGLELSDEQYGEMYYYLKANDCSEGAQEFAIEAMNAWDNSGDVDFEENIIFDKSLIDMPCHKIVIEEATGVCAPLTQAVLNAFEANDGTNLIFESSSTISSNGTTTVLSRYNPNLSTCDITIKFRESYLKTATELAIARTSIHESLHAVFVYMFEEGLLAYSDGSSNIDNFQKLTEAYIGYQQGLTSNLNIPHHSLMSEFVEDVASALSVYGSNNGYTNSFNFYKMLAWQGLTHTKDNNGNVVETNYFKAAYPNASDRKTVINTLASEQNNNSSYYDGNGNRIIPKGNPPNSTEPCN